MRQLGRKPALDGIRALAIAAVMGLHVIDRLFPGGYLGVDMFFVLSAFLITSLILDESGETGGRFQFRAFYWRRAFRLGPALLLWLLLLAWPTAVLIGQASGVPVWTLGSLLYVGDFLFAFGVPNGEAYSHVWSLAVEEQFYLLWPATLLLFIRRRPAGGLAGWLAGGWLAALALQALAGVLLDDANYGLPSGHLVPLATGIVLAAMYRTPCAPRLEAVAASTPAAAGAFVVLAVLIVGYNHLGALPTLALQAAAALATGCLVLHATVAQRPTLARRLLTLPPARWMGQRSYGLYLYHRTLTALIPALWPGIELRVAGPLVLITSVVLAELSFRFVEYPIQVRGRRWLASRGLSSGRQHSAPARASAA